MYRRWSVIPAAASFQPTFVVNRNSYCPKPEPTPTAIVMLWSHCNHFQSQPTFYKPNTSERRHQRARLLFSLIFQGHKQRPIPGSVYWAQLTVTFLTFSGRGSGTGTTLLIELSLLNLKLLMSGCGLDAIKLWHNSLTIQRSVCRRLGFGWGGMVTDSDTIFLQLVHRDDSSKLNYTKLRLQICTENR